MFLDVKCFWSFNKNLWWTYPCSIRSIRSIGCGPLIIWLPICAIGWGNGEFDGIPNCGPPAKPDGDAKCGDPNDGPELFGLPNDGAFGEPNGPLAFGPLYCGVSFHKKKNDKKSFN